MGDEAWYIWRKIQRRLRQEQYDVALYGADVVMAFEAYREEQQCRAKGDSR